MIPVSITQYLQNHRIPFRRRAHPRAVGGQELAASLQVSGWNVAKAVLVEGGGKRWLTVLPVAERVDLVRLADVLGVGGAHLLGEDQMQTSFPDCLLGAEPPFGGLYGLPVVLEESLTRRGEMVVRGGSHTEAIEISTLDFVRLEKPLIASFGVSQAYARQPPAQPVEAR